MPLPELCRGARRCLNELRFTSTAQRVTFERVHVNAGGPAIVGVVGAPGGRTKKRN